MSFPKKPKRFMDYGHLAKLGEILSQIQGGMSNLQALNKNMDTLDDDDFVAKMTTPSDDLTSQLDLALDFKDFLKSFGANSPLFLKEVDEMLNKVEQAKEHVSYFNSMLAEKIEKESARQDEQEKAESKKARLYTQAIEDISHSVQITVNSMTNVVAISSSIASNPRSSSNLPADKASTSMRSNARKRKRDNQLYPGLCILCRTHGHSTEDCEKYASVQSRVERINEINLCRVCLKHIACKAPCKTPPEEVSCSCCKGPHFTILCPINDIILHNTTHNKKSKVE